jgi:hypothetical protein
MSAPVYTQGTNWDQQDPPRRLAAFESLHEYRYKRCLIGIEASSCITGQSDGRLTRPTGTLRAPARLP